MQIIRGLHNLTKFKQNTCVTIGNFDGVHIGHIQVLQCLRAKAKQLNLDTVVVIFEPQPREYFQAECTVPRLTRLREKLYFLQQAEVDHVLCLKFNQDLANLSADDFIEKVLVSGLQAQYILTGKDFRFGHKRQGDFALLETKAQEYGFSVGTIANVESQAQRVSSSLIREFLAQGDLQTAAQLLGRDYSMQGRVAHGDKRGRIIGFPTANIYLHRKLSPIRGVFAVKILGIDNQEYFGVANIGNRPTVCGKRSLLEVHIFNFKQEIYGKHVEIVFLEKIRDEKQFPSFEELKAQIQQDAKRAREFFEISDFID